MKTNPKRCSSNLATRNKPLSTKTAPNILYFIRLPECISPPPKSVTNRGPLLSYLDPMPLLVDSFKCVIIVHPIHLRKGGRRHTSTVQRNCYLDIRPTLVHEL